MIIKQNHPRVGIEAGEQKRRWLWEKKEEKQEVMTRNKRREVTGQEKEKISMRKERKRRRR